MEDIMNNINKIKDRDTRIYEREMARIMKMSFVPHPPPHILKECVYSLFERLHTIYLEKGEETGLKFPLKDQVMWYMAQGKKVIFAEYLFGGGCMCIVFQKDDGSYDAVVDNYEFNKCHSPCPIIRTEPILNNKFFHTVFYTQYMQIPDFGLTFKKISDIEDAHYDIIDNFLSEGLDIEFSDVLTKAHMEYMARQSRLYMEEIWQKACHPTVVEKVITSYSSLEGFMDDPDAITPVCMLRAIV